MVCLYTHGVHKGWRFAWAGSQFYIIVVNAAFIERNNYIYLENSNIQPRGLFYKGQTKEKIFYEKVSFVNTAE